MVRLTTLVLSLACSALASPFVTPSDGISLERRKISDTSVTVQRDVEASVHERAISKAITNRAMVCDLTCKACMAKPAPKKNKGKGKAKSPPRSLVSRGSAQEERSLHDVEDLWGPGEMGANEYVMDQIESVAGRDDELDWNLLQHDAVSGHGSWNERPLRKYIRGLVGCTGIVIVSDKGYWFAHFMETGFLNRGPNWETKIIKPLQQGSNKFVPPRTLAQPGGILNKANDVRIYVSTPRTKTSTAESPVLLYKSKVDELLSHITGRGEPLNGVPVISRGYQTPESEAEAQEFHNRANGKILIEYDNNQLDADGHQPNPKVRMYRVWLEHKYYEHKFR
ncbi:hypothetical protein FBEOM_7130 [Fusarium beomiforme]|uniref:Uncharacterized protein n=1 Tax=Fusarium beomiforme TaxID=44412 RepID=A0A9P5DY02_9HYPO|nr:hypothetical protein FBEOM_7130 [Fusarium beomiforme]